MVVSALLAIGLKPHYRGVQIAYVSDISPAKNVLQQGMIISEVNGKRVESADEWNRIMKEYSGNVTLKVNGRVYKFHVNETIGIDVIDLDMTNLEFGLDIKGGTRILLKPKENASSQMLEQIIATLQTRANIYGLKEIRFIPVKGLGGNYFVQIEAAGLGREVVDELLSKQGNFEAKIVKPVYLDNGKGIFDLGENKYTIEYLGNETIRLANMTIHTNETFNLDDIEFEFVNVTADENTLIFMGTAYRGDDIQLVYTDAQHSGLIPRKNYFEFYFGILVSEEGAKRFAKITSGIPSQLDLNSGEYYLRDSKILLYLDKQLVSGLRIASTLGGKVYTTPQITGGRETRDDALQEKLRLQTILRSGALPVSLETVSVGVISPNLGRGFIASAIVAAALAALVVVMITFVRYRSLRVAIPLILTGLSEVIIILGVAATNDWFIWMGALFGGVF